MESRVPPKSRKLSLTEAHVARVHREVADPGLPKDMPLLGDADYAALIDQLLVQHRPEDDLHIFACGSLIWKPACDVELRSRAHLRGWRPCGD